MEDALRNFPFNQPGRFWRGNLHTHSTASDGRLAPEVVIGRYRSAGYDFIALTDHFLDRYDFPVVDTRSFRDEHFTTLLGAELHAPALAHGALWHLLAVGLPLDFRPPSAEETGPDLSARASAAGAFVGIAHPGWYALTLADALLIETADAVEIYNTTVAEENDRGDGWYISDQMAMIGRRHSSYAADDAHFHTRPDFGGAWVQVKAPSLEPGALLAALKAGHYYSSQGPEIHDIAISGSSLSVTCSPAAVIFLVGPGSLAHQARGDSLTQATFNLEPYASQHCRLTIIDAAGKRAWSNPIWLDEC
jgi:hypothetical protein